MGQDKRCSFSVVYLNTVDSSLSAQEMVHEEAMVNCFQQVHESGSRTLDMHAEGRVTRVHARVTYRQDPGSGGVASLNTSCVPPCPEGAHYRMKRTRKPGRSPGNRDAPRVDVALVPETHR